ncbi:MarR family winged helix-turn-helix transcriptional regulator [Streptomyces sp. NPDC091272]|uniref:MarR family winged helix-turn-helix transcriptional regulator n=1 Tax=Streptomyces sp. NPDC091272 TaxID=3365981 RepID=UPI00380B7831
MASTNERDPAPAAAAGAAPGPAADLQAFAVQLRRMNGEINRLVHGFAAGQGLHPTDIQALAAILDSETPLTPGKLREHLGLTSGAVTACLDRLESAGHIRRSRESTDRRVVHLHYLPGARVSARTHFMPLAEATERARGRFDDDELALVLRFLTELNAELDAVRVPRR